MDHDQNLASIILIWTKDPPLEGLAAGVDGDGVAWERKAGSSPPKGFQGRPNHVEGHSIQNRKTGSNRHSGKDSPGHG